MISSYIYKDAEIDQLKQEVRNLELEVEKQRIKSASIKEKIQFARNQLQTINEQKEQFDNLVKQKKVINSYETTFCEIISIAFSSLCYYLLI